jgi:hypothetical protein
MEPEFEIEGEEELLVLVAGNTWTPCPRAATEAWTACGFLSSVSKFARFVLS